MPYFTAASTTQTRFYGHFALGKSRIHVSLHDYDIIHDTGTAVHSIFLISFSFVLIARFPIVFGYFLSSPDDHVGDEIYVLADGTYEKI